MPLGLLQSQAEYEHERECVCVFRAFPGNLSVNLWVKATERKREGWHEHPISVPNVPLHLQSSSLRVLT